MADTAKRLGHVGIQVRDIEASIRFYREVAGLKLTANRPSPPAPRALCFLRGGDMHHNLVLFAQPPDGDPDPPRPADSHFRKDLGINHIAFELPSREAWLAEYERIKEGGAEIVLGPLVHGFEGGDENPFVGGSGSHSFYILDPDGNRVEFFCMMMRVTEPGFAARDFEG